MTGRHAILALLVLATAGGCRSLAPPSATPEELSVTLRAHDEILRPEGAGPFPVVLLVPGCPGPRSFHRSWAEAFVDAGFAAVILDSFTGRGLAPSCDDARRWGSGRAGDVLVTLADLRGRSFVDAERLALIGWSHGARAVSDAIAHGAAGRPPSGLSRLPDAGLAGLAGVRAAALVYPPCDFGSSATKLGWPRGVSGLLVLARQDRSQVPGACERTAVELAQRGVSFEVIVYEAQRGFDDPERDEPQRPVYDAVAAADARVRVGALFARRWSAAGPQAGRPFGAGGADRTGRAGREAR